MVKIIDSHKGLAPNELERIEFLYQVKLPHEYRTFLTQYNGGYPDPDVFYFEDRSNASSVDKFLAWRAQPNSDLEWYLKTYRGRIPDAFFPIAHDALGNLVLIGTEGSFAEQVYFWDHDFEADPGSQSMENMHRVSKSFADFLGGLTDDLPE